MKKNMVKHLENLDTNIAAVTSPSILPTPINPALKIQPRRKKDSLLNRFTKFGKTVLDKLIIIWRKYIQTYHYQLFKGWHFKIKQLVLYGSECKVEYCLVQFLTSHVQYLSNWPIILIKPYQQERSEFRTFNCI